MLNINQKLTTEERITKAKTLLMKSAPFYGYLIMNANVRETKNPKMIQTMGIDMKLNIEYNKEFVDTLSDAELQGVLCHEVMHPAFRHFIRLHQRDRNVWNVATDLFINHTLLGEGWKLPKLALLPKDGKYEIKFQDGTKTTIEIDNKTSEHMYEEIYKNLPPNSGGCKCGQDQDGDGKGKDGDGHSHSDEGKPCPYCNGGLPQFDNHNYAEDERDENGERLSDDELNDLEKRLTDKVVEAATIAKDRGNCPGFIEKMMDEMFNPQINWKTVLYKYITKILPYNYTMAKPGRRSYAYKNLYLPTILKESLEIVAAVDLSGSITSEEYGEFAAELISLARQFTQLRMKILYWDTRVVDELKVTGQNAKKILTHEVSAGGGTTMTCVKEHFDKAKKQHPRLVIFLTDGYIESNPQLPKSDCIFVLTPSGDDTHLKGKGKICYLKSKEGKKGEKY